MEYSHEIIVPNDDLPFKMFIFEGSQGGYIRQKHWHRSIEIFAVFDGEMEFYLNDKRYPLHPGEFMLVNGHTNTGCDIRKILYRRRIHIFFSQFQDPG